MLHRDGLFFWDKEREIANKAKHGLDFSTARLVFFDLHRKIFTDEKHSASEPRLFCIGKVDGRVITVRFTYRNGMIRIFGAGYWRKGRKYYAQKNDR